MKATTISGAGPEHTSFFNDLKIQGIGADDGFDDIIALAAQLCGMPIAAIAFFNVSSVRSNTSLELNFSDTVTNFSHWLSINYNIDNQQDTEAVVCPDCLADSRFKNNALVKDPGNIRFFAGVPIRFAGTGIAGFICVMDTKPAVIKAGQLAGLHKLARQAAFLRSLDIKPVETSEGKQQHASSNNDLMCAVFQNAIDAVIAVDEAGVIVQWNPKATGIFGWQRNEAIGKEVIELIIPYSVKNYYIKNRDAAAHNYTTGNQKTSAIIEIQALKKDNTETEIALGISPTMIEGIRYFIHYISDITDRISATKKLDSQKEFYENILNKLPTDIAVFDPNHKYLFVNPGAIKDEELRKYIIGKDDYEYAAYRGRNVSVANGRRERFLQVENSDIEMKWEDTLKGPDGTPITHLRRLFPVRNEEGELKMVIGYGIDITERKVMEEKQLALVKQLSAQNTQLVDFCNIVSHNLRAPLVNMSLLVKYIEESEDVEDQKELIDMLNPVIENLHNTFSELVESIQIKHNHEIEFEHLNVTDCMKRTLEDLNMEINKSEAIFETDFASAPVIYCPSKYLYSIFHNLLSNALKYQSPDRKPRIIIKTIRIDDNIILSVSDNGLGIDIEKNKDKIFKIGKVFHKHPKAKGFGLFMTKTQIDAIDGRIWVESKPDEGSTFFIEFKNQGI